jgi:hypothetical protein
MPWGMPWAIGCERSKEAWAAEHDAAGSGQCTLAGGGRCGREQHLKSGSRKRLSTTQAALNRVRSCEMREEVR